MMGELPFDPSYLDLNPHYSLSTRLQQRVCEIQLVQRFLYLFETPCKSSAEDAELGTVRLSQKSGEMPDIQHAVDVKLGTALVSQQLYELPHAPPVQAFEFRLGAMSH
ncbi:hypothetical protein TNCT_135781 [Trichonephila clavata]|uniref:Uncharacterized protein n=1 Tax=Trichonephila clavata TaxID=2740835 RepID=A0A8X6M3H0_TRICU|nr:hypothetical protein TNCT_135781 [Trichonephila clavata]